MRLVWIGERTRPRVLVAAPRRNELPFFLPFDAVQGFDSLNSTEKVRDGEGAVASTRGACAPQINWRGTFS